MLLPLELLKSLFQKLFAFALLWTHTFFSIKVILDFVCTFSVNKGFTVFQNVLLSVMSPCTNIINKVFLFPPYWAHTKITFLIICLPINVAFCVFRSHLRYPILIISHKCLIKKMFIAVVYDNSWLLFLHNTFITVNVILWKSDNPFLMLQNF